MRLVGGDLLDVLARGGAGDGEQDAALAQAVHHGHDPVIGAGAAAGVRGLLRTLDADGGADIAHFEQPVGYAVVDHGGVGEHQEDGMGMALGHVEKMRPHERLASQHDVDPGADRLSLVDDALDLFFGQFFLGGVFRRVAAYALQIAPHRGTDEYRRRR